MKSNYKNKELGKKLDNERNNLINIIALTLDINPNLISSLPIERLRQMASVALRSKKVADSELLRNFDLTHADDHWQNLFEKYHHAKQHYVHENASSKKYLAPQSKAFEMVKIFAALRTTNTLLNILGNIKSSDANPLNKSSAANIRYNDNQIANVVNSLNVSESFATLGK